MLRGEQFRKLRTEDREGGNAEERGEMARAGVVADEARGAGERVEQLAEIAQGIVEHDDFPAGRLQSRRDHGEPIGRPLAHGLTRAGVNHDATIGSCGCRFRG